MMPAPESQLPPRRGPGRPRTDPDAITPLNDDAPPPYSRTEPAPARYIIPPDRPPVAGIDGYRGIPERSEEAKVADAARAEALALCRESVRDLRERIVDSGETTADRDLANYARELVLLGRIDRIPKTKNLGLIHIANGIANDAAASNRDKLNAIKVVADLAKIAVPAVLQVGNINNLQSVTNIMSVEQASSVIRDKIAASRGKSS